MLKLRYIHLESEMISAVDRKDILLCFVEQELFTHSVESTQVSFTSFDSQYFPHLGMFWQVVQDWKLSLNFRYGILKI